MIYVFGVFLLFTAFRMLSHAEDDEEDQQNLSKRIMRWMNVSQNLKLADFAPRTWGVDVEALRRRVAADRATLARDGDASGGIRTDPPRIQLRRAS
jgi:hypothetical protein